MDFFVYVFLAFFFAIFPLSACLLLDKYRQFFRGSKVLLAISLYSLLSWSVTNGVIYFRYLLDPMSLQGPEGVFALFFGWLYLWITSIPVFLIHLIIRVIAGVTNKKKQVLRRFVPQLCTKTPDKQIQNVESTSFTRKKSTNLNVRINPDLSIDKP